MARSDRPQGRWRRLLGGPDSWRRIALAGIGGGVALAFVAALVAALIRGSGSGSLDPKTSTPVAPADGPVDAAPATQPPPSETPPIETPPAEPSPTETSSETPPPAPTPTEPPIEPTETPVGEEPTPEPTAPK